MPEESQGYGAGICFSSGDSFTYFREHSWGQAVGSHRPFITHNIGFGTKDILMKKRLLANA